MCAACTSYAQSVLDAICPAEQLHELCADMAARAPEREHTAPCAQLAICDHAASVPAESPRQAMQQQSAGLKLERWWWYFQQ